MRVVRKSLYARSAAPTVRLSALIGLAVFTLFSSGCNLAELRDSNRRLKEENARLLIQANQLEQNLVIKEEELNRRNSEIARLESQLDSALRSPVAEATPPARSRAPQEFEDMGLEAGTSALGTWVRLDSAVFFALGKADLSGKGKRQLDTVAGILRSRYGTNRIRVEGHTDDTPVRKVKHLYPTNWELSSARACSVVRYLVSKGVIPDRIYPAGFSKYRPASHGKSANSRKKNRRVEILILNQGQI